MKTASPEGVRAFCEVPFDFVDAKVRGRRGRLCEGRRLRELCRERTVPDLALRLYPSLDVHERLGLERRIMAGCVSELASFLVYLAEPHHAFFLSLLDRYVVEDLKALLRLAGGQGSPAGATLDPGDYLIELPPQLELPVESLLASESVEVFVGRIPLASVRECAQQALPLYGETRRRAYLEMAFDKGFWANVWEALARLPAGEPEQCWEPLRYEFDAMRLLGTLRAAGVYGMPWEQLHALLPVGPGRIGVEALHRVHAAPTLEVALEAAPWMGRALVGLAEPEGPPDLGRLEEGLWRELVRLANRQYYTQLGGPAVLVSYHYLKRAEMRHLFTLTQMLRYGAQEDEIADVLGV